MYLCDSIVYGRHSVLFCFTDEKPIVECSFITEFEDHIFVSVDAEAFLFLHDLISSYIKEKDRVVSTCSYPLKRA